jgi:hypothetical protein
VIDVYEKHVFFKTNQAQQQKNFAYKVSDFERNSPVKLIDWHLETSGEVRTLFEDYSDERNAEFVDISLDNFVKHEDYLAEIGGSLATWRSNMKAFAASPGDVK